MLFSFATAVEGSEATGLMPMLPVALADAVGLGASARRLELFEMRSVPQNFFQRKQIL
jgi:hypothetical protein